MSRPLEGKEAGTNGTCESGVANGELFVEDTLAVAAVFPGWALTNQVSGPGSRGRLAVHAAGQVINRRAAPPHRSHRAR
jgi:hypothetical protein